PQLREHYGVPGECKEGLGFPTSHLLLLMDQRSGLFIDCVDNPLGTSDLSQAQSMYRHMEAGDVLLGDHGFSGWGPFCPDFTGRLERRASAQQAKDHQLQAESNTREAAGWRE